MNLHNIEIEKIIPYARNPRDNSGAVDKVAASIQEFGFQQPIVLDLNNVIVAGHTRFLAAKKLGLEKVPVQIADKLSKAQIKAYRLADNRVAQEAKWDDELLAIELTDLNDQGFDLDLTGFDYAELETLMDGEEIKQGLIDDDDVPNISDSHICRENDLWVLGDHRLFCGDSTLPLSYKRLMRNDTADLLFTDPPFGINYGGGRSTDPSKQFSVMNSDDLVGDSLVTFLTDSLGYAKQLLKEGSASYVCCTWRSYNEFKKALGSIGVKSGGCIVWDKKHFGLGHSDYRSQHEFIFYGKGEWYGERNQSDVWHMSRETANKVVHPTQKPVELVSKAILNSSKKGDIILDPFGGSGSTLIACDKLSRCARILEIDPKYADVIIRRWQNYRGEHAMLDGKTFTDISMIRSAA